MAEGFALHEILTDASDRPVDYRFLDVNPAFEVMTGLPRERWIGHSILEIMPTTEPYWVETYGRVALTGEPTRIENYSGPLGRWFEVFAFCPAPRQFAVLFSDITTRKTAEAELRSLTEGLEQRVKERTAQLESTNKELEAFSYSVSHDLRGPLRGIDGFSRALAEDYRDRLDETGRHYLERIRGGTQRMGQLIDDLLKLSRINRSELDLAEVDLSELCAKALGDLVRAYPERRVQASIQEGLRIRADRRLLLLVVENLLGNAWKFTARQPDAWIEVGETFAPEGDRCFFVRDNGAGFDMVYAHKLFNAFQRLHSAGEFEGTGIGLAICQRIIHRHGGRIWVASEPEKGATFSFTIPERGEA
jgi:PAS domain S-box-containing protein